MSEMINPFGFTKTEVAIFEMGETSGWSMGARAERERIIKLLEGYQSKKCNDYECFSVFNRNEHDYECGVDELQRVIALIKGENKPFITTKQAEELTNEMLEE